MPYELLPLLRARGDGEAMTGQTLAEQSLKTGDRWTFRDTFALDTADADIVVANDFPDDVLRVVSIRLAADDQFTGTLQTNASVDTSGTLFDWIPDRHDGTDGTLPSGIVVESGGTYSATGQSIPVQSTGGTGTPATRTPLNAVEAAVARVEPGGAFRYTISDDSGNPNTLLASITISRAAPPGDR